MTKKFTEEQYQKIVEIGEKYQDDRIVQIKAIFSFTYDIALNLIEIVNRAIAIANPLTREWAHEHFVEKEKEYYWRLKYNWKFWLTTHHGATQINLSLSCKDKLTESAIKRYGYDPKSFDREEE